MAALAQSGRRPMNVLLIMADDMNNSLGCYGHPLVKTPNLDALAARGVRFDRAYCQFPLCGPSRASMHTGLRPDVTRVLDNNVDFRDHIPNAVTMPQLFKNSGYFTARTGKMYHMNVPNEVGTPRFQDPPSWTHDHSPQGLELKTEGEGLRTNPMPYIVAKDARGQADENAADEAISVLEKHRNEPFFLGCGLIRPHLPFVAPGKYFDMYPAGKMDLRVNPPDDLDDIPAAHKAIRANQWNHQKMSPERQRMALQGYYASTSFMDYEAGRVMDALQRLNLADRTVVVFVGDHGWNLGEHTRWMKMSLFEESARVPLLVAAPGMKGNGKGSRALVEMVDIYGTTAELAGLKPPADYQGTSMVPLLQSPERRWKSGAFTQIQFQGEIVGRSIRTDRYRYMKWEGHGDGEELYDHQTDAHEFTNLAGKPEHAATLGKLRGALKAGWQSARPTV